MAQGLCNGAAHSAEPNEPQNSRDQMRTRRIAVDEQNVDLIALDEALDRLAKIDEQQVRLVELRYFSGLTLEAAAEALKISRATAAREWNVARAWLYRELTGSGPEA